MIVKADKGIIMVTLNRNTYKLKIHDFLNEKKFTIINKDPTEQYHKQVPQAIHSRNLVINKQHIQYLSQIKPTARVLNARIKIHIENDPIRPIVNNTQAATYKSAEHLCKQLNEVIRLPHTYAANNSSRIANYLIHINIKSNQSHLNTAQVTTSPHSILTVSHTRTHPHLDETPI
jgi:hypothetical protein